MLVSYRPLANKIGVLSRPSERTQDSETPRAPATHGLSVERRSRGASRQVPGSTHLHEGKATRAYAHTILDAYKRFRDDAPRRGMTPAIMNKVRNAGLPSAPWAVIMKKAKALDPSLMP